MPGEPNTQFAYRSLQEDKEKVDLKDWKDKQTDDERRNLSEFQQYLRAEHHVVDFSNIDVFRRRLESTLRVALDKHVLSTDVQPGTPLADLLLDALPAIRRCSSKVITVANSKAVHDRLHELLYKVIRPLWAEVIDRWQPDSALSPLCVVTMRRLAGKMSRCFGELGQKRLLIAEHSRLRERVDRVLTREDQWNGAANVPDAQLNRETLIETAEVVAQSIQSAFSEADLAMLRDEGDISEQYRSLRTGLELRRHRLSPDDQEQLDQKLAILDARRESVRQTLENHHDWQQAHNTTEELTGFREREQFERQLARRQDDFDTLASLLDGELAATTPILPPGDLRPLLLRLRTALSAIKEQPSIDAFDEMRNAFDDAFYYLDRRTLYELEEARKRVEELQDWLEKLARASMIAQTRSHS